MSRTWTDWYCRECGERGRPISEREDDGSFTLTCPSCGRIEVRWPQRDGHHV